MKDRDNMHPTNNYSFPTNLNLQNQEQVIQENLDPAQKKRCLDNFQQNLQPQDPNKLASSVQLITELSNISSVTNKLLLSIEQQKKDAIFKFFTSLKEWDQTPKSLSYELILNLLDLITLELIKIDVATCQMKIDSQLNPDLETSWKSFTCLIDILHETDESLYENASIHSFIFDLKKISLKRSK